MEFVSDLTWDQVKQYINVRCGPNEVNLNEYKWTDGELFTTIVVSCLVPIVVDEKAGILGLGHFFPSSPMPWGRMGHHQIQFRQYVEETGRKVIEGGKLRMYLFGGTEGDMLYLRKTRNAAMYDFSALGIECVDLTPTQTDLRLGLIIANMPDRTIRYHYGSAQIPA